MRSEEMGTLRRKTPERWREGVFPRNLSASTGREWGKGEGHGRITMPLHQKRGVGEGKKKGYDLKGTRGSLSS